MPAALKILVVFGSRPEAIKMFPVIQALKRDARFAVSVCASGQHQSLLDQALDIFDVSPDHHLSTMVPGQSLDNLCAVLLVKLGEVMDKEQPDWVLVQGDTATAMTAALAAYHRQIPVAHIEAGLRSHDIYRPWPEEANRRIIASVAALHFAPTGTAAAALLKEGVNRKRVHLTGNTGIDALFWIMSRIEREPDLIAGLEPLARRFSGKRIIVATVHRRESLGATMAGIAQALRQIARRDDVALIVPLHPNPAVRAELEPVLSGLDNVALIEPLDYPHFVGLLVMCDLVLTDSGGVQEEAPACGCPVLVLRDTTERSEAISAGTARLIGTRTDRIVAETCVLLDDAEAYQAMARRHNPFGDGKAALRIVDLLAEEALAMAARTPFPKEGVWEGGAGVPSRELECGL